MNELLPVPDTNSPFRLGVSGLEIIGEVTPENWRAAFAQLHSATRSLMWAVGDLLVLGREHYPDVVAAAIEEVGFADETLRVAEWVSSAFPAVRRLTQLSFSHHQEAASLPAAAAAKVLKRAAKANLPTREVRRLVREEKRKTKTKSKPKPFVDYVELAEIRGWLEERMATWPEVFRPAFVRQVRNILDSMERDQTPEAGAPADSETSAEGWTQPSLFDAA